MPKKWNTLESKEIFVNSIFGFREDKVESPKTKNGAIFRFSIETAN